LHPIFGSTKLSVVPALLKSQIHIAPESLLRSTRERLKLWDISDEQIKKLDETGEVTKTLTFNAPVSGFVTDRKAFPQTVVTPGYGPIRDQRSLHDLGERGNRQCYEDFLKRLGPGSGSTKAAYQ
jgi:hypothetical protein